MKVLLIGYSRIACRRVIPALLSIGAKIVGIASVSSSVRAAEAMVGPRIYDSYDVALESSDADVVYVSTVNSRHFFVAERALQRGFHVVVDKPSFLEFDNAVRLVELARSQGRCLAEAVVFSYHPRIRTALQLLEKNPTSILTATFSFPPLPDTDFRYVRQFGGGAIWDLGPYAAACGRIFFKDCPVEVTTRVTSSKHGVEDGFSVLAVFGADRVLMGSFGYRTSYVNTLEAVGTEFAVRLERVFSPPLDLATEIVVQQNSSKRTLSIEPADTFANFFSSLFQAINTGQYATFMEDLLWDARTMRAIRNGCGHAMQAVEGR